MWFVVLRARAGPPHWSPIIATRPSRCGRRQPWRDHGRCCVLDEKRKPSTKSLERIGSTMETTSPRSIADADSYYGSDAAQDFMSRLFSSCSEDPKGSVHRAWGLTLIFLVMFFVVSVFESTFSLDCDVVIVLPRPSTHLQCCFQCGI